MQPNYKSFDNDYVLKQWHVLFVLHHLCGIQTEQLIISISFYQFNSHVCLFSYHNLLDALTTHFYSISDFQHLTLKHNSIYKTISCHKTTAYTLYHCIGRLVGLQYIPRNMHKVFALLCFVVVIHWLIFPYPSGLLHWHCGNLTIAPMPAKQPWWIWINTSCEFIMNDCITTTKQSTTKPCAYFLGNTVRQMLISNG